MCEMMSWRATQMLGGHHGRALKLCVDWWSHAQTVDWCALRFFEAGSASGGCQAMASLRGRAIAEHRLQTLRHGRTQTHGTILIVNVRRFRLHVPFTPKVEHSTNPTRQALSTHRSNVVT